MNSGFPFCVLLSGGMDSTAALHWALARSSNVRAVAFDYGQPHRDPELAFAQRVAERRDVPFEIVHLGEVMHSGILERVPAHEPVMSGPLHRAFVPGRNLIFLSVALARAAQWWSLQPFGLVIGACNDDAAGFPDCRPAFLSAADDALSRALDRSIHVFAPWASETKEGIVAAAKELSADALTDLLESWSCYDGKGPCGVCTACVVRARALSAHGLTDRSARIAMCGGDPGRELR